MDDVGELDAERQTVALAVEVGLGEIGVRVIVWDNEIRDEDRCHRNCGYQVV